MCQLEHFYAYVWMLSRLSISDFGYQSNDYKDKSREVKEMYSLVIYDAWRREFIMLQN